MFVAEFQWLTSSRRINITFFRRNPFVTCRVMIFKILDSNKFMVMLSPKRFLHKLLRLGVLVGLVGGASLPLDSWASGTPVYQTDFESTVGSEWSTGTLDNSYPSTFTRFLGRFGNQSTSLTLQNLQVGSPYTLFFDLYIIDSWDGDNYGPDTFRVFADSVSLFNHTISQFNGSQSFTVPADVKGQLGFSGWEDSIFRQVVLTFTPSSSTSILRFEGANLQSLDDESWGIDNVNVWKSDELAAVDIISTTLPDEAASRAVAIDRFSITARRPLGAASAADPASYELRQAGANGIFGDSDDFILSVFPTLSGGGKTVFFRLPVNPLQPGKWRFKTRPQLADDAGNSVAEFVRSFEIRDPDFGRIENLENDSLPGATALPMFESSPGLGFFNGFGIGTFDHPGDADFWRFDAEAGDHISVTVVARDQYGVYPSISLYTAASTPLTSVGGGYYEGYVRLQDYVIGAPGTYYLRLAGDNATSQYQFRVEQSRGTQLEVENNDVASVANRLGFQRQGEKVLGLVAGTLDTGDAADYFGVGTLNAGNSIRVSLTYPGGSTLQVSGANLALQRLGDTDPVATSGSGVLNQTVALDGAYVLRVTSDAGSPRAEYILKVEIQDAVPPQVVSADLPDEGSSTTSIVNGFSVTFNEDLLVSSVIDPAIYELRWSSTGVFGGPGDVVYPLIPAAYSSGVVESFTIGGGPLQPGYYRLTVGTGIQDRSGNHTSNPYLREFSIIDVTGFHLENRSNGTPGGATPLGIEGGADGTIGFGGYLGVGSNPYDVAQGDFNGDGHADLVTANISSGDVSVLLGNGNGTFRPAVNLEAGNGPIGVTVGDLNGDGRADIAVADYYGSSVSILLGNGDGSFAPAVTFASGTNPRNIRVGDLDGDGVPEIVTANSGASSISIFKRNPDGSHSRTDVEVGSGPWSVALADLNGDGRLDISVVNYNSSQLNVLLNSGAGSWSSPASYSVGPSPVDVAVADVDGDGKPDVVILNQGSLSMLHGLGDGTLGPADTVGGIGSSPFHLVLSDLNGDGKPDVAVAVYGSSQLTRFLNRGDGTFEAPLVYSVDYNPIGVVLGDWNEDGVVDLATANYNGSNVAVWLGARSTLLVEDPPGLFTGLARGSLSSTSDYDYFRFSGKAGDVLSVAVETVGNPPASQLYYRVDGPNGAYTTDFYANSYYGWGQSTPVVLPNDGTYTVFARYNYDYRGEYRIRVSLARAGLQMEVENSGNDSLSGANALGFQLQGHQRSARVAGYIGVGDSIDTFRLGYLSAGTTAHIGRTYPTSSSLKSRLAIVRNDGTVLAQGGPDDASINFVVPSDDVYFAQIQAVDGAGLRSQYLLNIELSDIQAPIVSSVDLPAEGSSTTEIIQRFHVVFNKDLDPGSVQSTSSAELRFSVNDVFGDSDDTVYSISSPGYSGGLIVNYQINDGPLQPGHYQFTLRSPLSDLFGNTIAVPFVRHFEVKALPGFTVENRSNDTQGGATALGIEGGPDGTIGFGGYLGVGSNPYDVAQGDFNGDGHADLVTANISSGNVSVLLGNGDGTFRSAVNLEAGNGPIGVTVGDLNGDGRADIAVADYYGSTVSILLGNGDGSFAPATTFASGANPRNLRMGDLDGDGVPEIVTANSGASSISIFKRNSDGSYSRTDVEAGSGPWSVALADLNGDGRLDISVANYNSSQLNVLLNGGSGSWSTPVAYSVGPNPVDVAVADVDGDGKRDVVTLNQGSLSVLHGVGDGTFGLVDTVSGIGNSPYHLALSDLNGDGKPDVAVAVYGNNQLTRLLNRGDGTFEAPLVYSVGYNPIGVVAGDWNEDGVADLATANHNGANVAVWLGTRSTLLAEDPPGLFTGLARGSLSSTSDYDYFRFSGKAGDVLSVAVETVGNPPASQLYYRVDGPNGAYLTDFYANSYYGWGQSTPVVLPNDGTYTVFARYNYDYRGEYRIRVSLARNGLQVEREDNNSLGQANTVRLSADDGKSKGRITGYFSVGDLGVGDYFDLGTLSPGNIIHLGLTKPSTSRASGAISVFGPDGTQVATQFNGSETTVNVGDGQQGNYTVRVSPSPGRRSARDRSNILFSNGAYGDVPVDIPENAMTVSFWFFSWYPSAGLFEAVSGPLGSGGHDRHLYLNNGNIYARLWSNEVIGSSDRNFADGQWHHVAYEFGAAISGQRIYVDGVLVASGVKSYSDFNWQQRISIGHSSDLGFLNGSVEDLSIWDSPLSESDIAGLIANSPAGSEAGLVGCWKLDEGRGDVLRDSSPNAHDGTLQNSPGWAYFGTEQGLTSGLLTQYILNVSIEDSVPPTVTALDVADEGGSTSALVNRLTVQFSEKMSPSSVATPENYELRWSANDVFGDADDIVYDLNPDSYDEGLSEGLTVAQGPLQPGNYQFLARQGLKDRAGNPLATPFIRHFSVVNPDGFVIENRSNDRPLTATPFGPPSSTGASPLAVGNFPVGSNPYDIAAGDLDGDGILDLVVPNISSTDVSVLIGRGDGTFNPVRNLPGLRRGIGVTIGDLNGDGRPDIVIANYYDAGVSVFYNLGGGNFSPVERVATGNYPINLRLADTDGDGRPEILVSNLGENFVTVLKRAVDGSFSRLDVPTGSGPWAIGAGDFDGDGKPDLAVGNSNEGTVTVLRNDGTGAFTSPINYSVGNGPRDLSVGDVDGDGKLDIVVVNGGSEDISVLRGNGDGTFRSALRYPGTGNQPYHLVLADLNQDGHLDVAVADYGSSLLTQFLNQGDGTFGLPVPQSIPGNPIGVVAGDWNRDGVIDLATANHTANTVTILLGTRGTEWVEDPPNLLTASVRGSLSSYGDRDFYRFSARAGDIATIAVENPGNPGASQLYFELDGPTGTRVTYFYPNYYGTGQSSPISLPYDGTYTVYVAPNYDFRGEYRIRVTLLRGNLQAEYDPGNGDGIGYADSPSFDLVSGLRKASIAGYISTQDTGDVHFLGNLGAGTLVKLTLRRPVNYPWDSGIELLRADGSVAAASTSISPEIEFTVPDGNAVAYYARVRSDSGAGLLAQYILDIELTDILPPTIASVDLPPQGATSTALVDGLTLFFSEDMDPATVNDTGNLELRGSINDTFGDTDDTVYQLRSGSYSVGLGTSYVIINGPLQPGNYRFTVGTGFKDKSGNSLATPFVRTFRLETRPGFIHEGQNNQSFSGATSLSTLPPGDFDRSFTQQATLDTGSRPYDLVSRDLNGDGHLDLVVAYYGSSQFAVFLGNGDGTFRSPVTYATGSNPYSLVAADLNGDGIIDIASADYSSNDVTLWFGAGDGTFATPAQIQESGNPIGLTSGDFNQDGISDLAVTRYSENRVDVFLGTGHGSFGDRISFPTGDGPAKVASADVNHDGFLDLVVGNNRAATVSVFLGDGAGGFSTGTPFGTGNGPYTLAVNDVTGDGIPDIIVANEQNASISLLRGDGTGGFAAKVDIDSGGNSPYLAVADLNMDGLPDLVVGNYRGQNIGIWYNQGDGHFSDPSFIRLGFNPTTVTVGDWNQDGAPDLASANYDNNNITIFSGNRYHPMALNTVGHGIRSAMAYGKLLDGNDADYWSFSAKKGDQVTIGLETPGHPGASQLYYRLTDFNGQVLLGFYPDYYGVGQSAPFTIPSDGTYGILVTQNYGYYQEYQMRIVETPPDVSPETEGNDSPASTSALKLVAQGDSWVGTGVGYIRGAGDLDYFDLGEVEAGRSIFLNTRLMDGATFSPVASVYDAGNGYRVEASGGRPFDAVAEVTVTQTGRYFAAVRGSGTQGGLREGYVLEVQTVPTSNVQFPNLQVTSLTPPSGNSLRSGDQVTVEFTVQNVGRLSTGVGSWSDRLVLSQNQIYGDLDDVELTVIPHTGALDPGADYHVSQSVRLPDGIDGAFYLIAQTDSANAVSEFVLEGDNTTISDAPIQIRRADYPDLRPENVVSTVNGAILDMTWTMANRGAGAVGQTFKETVAVRNTATGLLAYRVERTVTGGLDSQATISRQESIALPDVGRYQVEITEDSGSDIYEFDATSHASAEGNNIALSFFDVFADLTVDNLRLDPSGAVHSGDSVVVRWNDILAGNHAVSGSWNDRIVVVNRSTSATLLDTTLPHPTDVLGGLFPGQSHARELSFVIPDLNPGVGILDITVTVDSNGQIAESNPNGTAESNNSALIQKSSVLSAYPDIVTVLSAIPELADAGQPYSLTWTNRNDGTASTHGGWLDQVFLVSSPDGSNPRFLGSLPSDRDLAPHESSDRNLTVTLPSDFGGRRFIVVLSDVNNQVLEVNKANNRAVSANSVLVRRPNLIPTGVAGPNVIDAGQTITVNWTDRNDGDGRVFPDWKDAVYLSPNPDGSAGILLGVLSADGGLAAGTTLARSASFAVPYGINGIRYLVVVADSDGTVTESNELDNRVLASSSVRVRAPDLAVFDGAAQTTAAFGDTIPVRFTLTNLGGGAATGAWLDNVYLSRDAVFGGDTLLYSRPAGDVSPLSSGASAPITVNVQLPRIGAPGRYYLFVQTDSTGVVPEANENNNLSAPIPIALVLPPLPDLIVDEISAPTTVLPGQSFDIHWLSKNVGNAATQSSWSESVSLSTDDQVGNDILLQSLIVKASLVAGSQLDRVTTVTLPSDGPSGVFRLVVSIDVGDSVLESNEGNNVSVSTGSIIVPPTLALSDGPTSVAENDGPISFTVTRNGSRSSALVVNLSSSDISGLSVPASVTIPSGASSVIFQATPVDDGVVTDNKSVQITLVADGFPSVSRSVEVRNVDLPHLTLLLDSDSVLEGLTVGATVTRQGSLDQSLTVTLNSSDSVHVIVPPSLTIPSGAASASVILIAFDDTEIGNSAEYTVSALAPGFQGDAKMLAVRDNDGVTLTFTIAPATVSEGAGAGAATGTITRNPASSRALALRLAGSDDRSAIVPGSLVIPANQATVTFPIAVMDNAVVDGARTVTFTPTILVNGSPYATGPSATLTVTDNDGPTLGLAIATKVAREGLNPASSVTVSRNTDASSALEVHLSTDVAGKLSIPNPVTIPAGLSSVTFDVASIDDGITGGNKAVTLTASADGFVAGSDSITITDVNLPDLVVTGFQFPEVGGTESQVSATYTVKNQGVAPARGAFVQRLYLSADPFLGNDTFLSQYVWPGPSLPTGSSFDVRHSFYLPRVPGNYYLIAVTDAAGAVSELNEDNNSRVSVTPIQVDTTYTATVQTDLEVALAGTPVPLHGRIFKRGSGDPVPFGLANVYIRVRGTSRVIAVLADADGRFEATFTPLPREAGVYEIGADHPGLSTAATQDTFTLLGLKANPETASIRVIEGSRATGTVQVENLSNIPLHGASVRASGNLPNVSTTASLTQSTVPGLGSIELDYTLSATDASYIAGTVILTVTTSEGVELQIPVYVGVDALRAVLVASPSSVGGGMKRGEQRSVEVTISNQGGLSSGPLSVSLPPGADWLRTSTPTLAALAPGESAKVSLLLSPGADLPLGDYKGSFTLIGTTSSLDIPFSFRCLSDAKGDLRVRVEDEFTFYAAGAPRVAGASVEIADAISGETVANGVTNDQGELLVTDLFEGYYNVTVQADKHSSFRGAFLVRPGTVSDAVAFISRQTVSYNWTVTPIEIEDRYQVTIETTFETFVPTPVITLDPPSIDLNDYPLPEQQILLTIKNSGLIAAQGGKLNFSQHPYYEITPLVEDVGLIPAMGSVTIPVTIKNHSPGTASAGSKGRRGIGLQGSNPGAPCTITAGFQWFLICGLDNKYYWVPLPVFGVRGDCTSRPSDPNPFYYVPSTGPSGPVGPGPNWIINPVSQSPSPSCQACDSKTFVKECYRTDLGNYIRPLASGLLGTIKSLPVIKNLKAPDIKAEAQLCTCCLDGGRSLEGKGSASVEIKQIELTLPIAGTFFEIKDTVGNEDVKLLVSLGSIRGELSAGGAVGGEAEAKCRLSQVKAKAFARVQAEPKLVADAGIKYSFTDKTTGLKTFSGEDRVYLEVGTKLYGELFADTDAGVGGQACVDPVKVTGGVSITDPVSGQIHRFELVKELTKKVCVPNMATVTSVAMVAADGVTFGEEMRAANRASDAALRVAQEEMKAIQLQVANQALTAAPVSFGPTPTTVTTTHTTGPQAASPSRKGLRQSDASGVCARVKLRLEQSAVLTRNAFDARLELVNNDESLALTDINVQLTVLDGQGNPVSELFAIKDPILSGLTGVDGTGVLGTKSTGTASWILIPTRDAAPTVATVYRVGALLQYSVDGRNVTVPLDPVAITVYPDPLLTLQYFHQRDVYSDDPFTPEKEPAIPYSLAVLVKNSGYGDAKHFKITSAQPQIIDNEKGLLIDFQLIATQVGNDNLQPSLTVDFGDIPSRTSKTGRWLFTSTLQGLFVDYSATFEHLDAIVGKKTSLIDAVSIHEMIHLVEAGGGLSDGQPDFLVNDDGDDNHLPDTLYLSNGSTNDVQVVTSAIHDGPPSSVSEPVHLVASMPSGWGYLQIPDPADGKFRLRRVLRSDGTELPVGLVKGNAWVTDRTFIGNGHRPIVENVLHLLDKDGSGKYTLEYEEIPLPDTVAPVSRANPLPERSPRDIVVTWDGTDSGGSGLAGFDVYVSTDGGGFTRWLQQSSARAATYAGIVGHRYSFFTRASDGAGNMELGPEAPDAETIVAFESSAPSLSTVPPQTTSEDVAITGVPLTVLDADTPQNQLQFTVLSSNPTLVDAAGVFIEGSTSDRTIRIQPAAGRFGQTTLSIRVSDGVFSAENQFLVTVEFRNHPPVPGPDSITRKPGKPIRVAVTQLLANDTDPEFDPLSVTGVSAVSANNGGVSLREGQIVYIPPTGSNSDLDDAFTYTVSDGTASATGTVTVRVASGSVAPTQNLLSAQPATDGLHLYFIGVIGKRYSIQRATDLSSPVWVTIGTSIPDSNGRFEFVDSSAPVGTAFYRAVESSSP